MDRTAYAAALDMARWNGRILKRSTRQIFPRSPEAWRRSTASPGSGCSLTCDSSALHFPVDDLLIEVRNEAGSSDTSSNNASVARRIRVVRRVADLAPQEIYLALHRHENSVYYKRLHLEDYTMLESLKAGQPLEAAITAGFADSVIPENIALHFCRRHFRPGLRSDGLLNPRPSQTSEKE